MRFYTVLMMMMLIIKGDSEKYYVTVSLNFKDLHTHTQNETLFSLLDGHTRRHTTEKTLANKELTWEIAKKLAKGRAK